MPRFTAQEQQQRLAALLAFLPLHQKGQTGRGSTELQRWAKSQPEALSYRTVLRDLQALSGQGLALSVPYGKANQWYRTPAATGHGVMSGEQALTYALVDCKLKHLLPASLYQQLQGLIDKAKQTLNRPDMKVSRSWFDKVVVVPPLLELPVLPADIFQVVISALLQEHYLEICYKQRNQEVMEKQRIMPLGVADVGGVYYLVCRFWEYENIRHLRFDRIITAAEQDELFTYPPDFNLGIYVKSGAFQYANGNTLVLKLKMRRYTAQHLIEQPLADDQIMIDIENDDAWVEVHASVQDGQRLRWWLQALGLNVEVLQPLSLRADMQAHYRQLIEIYDSITFKP